MKNMKITPLKAIYANCKKCALKGGGSPAKCESKECDLYPFRMGKNPFLSDGLTEEQKEARRERMRKASQMRRVVRDKLAGQATT